MTSSVERVELPGIGFRSTFSTREGVDVGVLEHNSGSKELLVYSQEDPDRCASVVRLDDSEAQAMADLLGVIPATVVDTLHLGALVLRSALVHEDSLVIGQSIARSDIEVTILGIVRNDELLPTNEALIKPGDVVLVAGPSDAVSAAVELVESGP